MNSKLKQYFAGSLALLVVLLVVAFLRHGRAGAGAMGSPPNWYAVDALEHHAHGLAVDVRDARKLYLATHRGIFVLRGDRDLYQIGKSQDDYMGFSVHPTDPQVFFSSGHPSTGGNIGFQRSDDGGVTWKKISSGVNGPVDFHAMAVSPVNPNLIFGWYAGQLQRSVDGGLSWEALRTNINVAPVSLIADPQDENMVYAINAESRGVLVSRDKGVTWTVLSQELAGGTVNAFAVNPQDARTMLSFSAQRGLAKSGDGGVRWEKNQETFGGEEIFFLAFSKQGQWVYTLTEHNSIYKSLDGGNTWSKVR